MTTKTILCLAAALALVPAATWAGTVASEMQVSVSITGEPEYAAGYLVPLGAAPDAGPITLADSQTAPQLSPIPEPAPR